MSKAKVATIRQPEIQQGITGLKSEVALQDFEASLEATPPKPGRPKGSKNHDVDTVDAPPTACRKCKSTRRAPYWNKRVVEVSGVDSITGQVYTAIVYRRTMCEDCGQHRDDRTPVNEPSRRSKK
jgi:hypothetical protein